MKKASASELVVLNILWAADKALSRSEITKIANASPYDRGWEEVTVSTFVIRLENKGLVRISRRDNLSYVSPALSRNEYAKQAVDSELVKKTGRKLDELILEYLDIEYNDLNLDKLVNCLSYMKA